MITRDEALQIVESYKVKGKYDVKFELVIDKVENLIRRKAKLGLHELHISHKDIGYLSDVDFRDKFKSRLEVYDFKVDYVGNNTMKIKW